MTTSSKKILKIRKFIHNLNIKTGRDFKRYQRLSYQFININERFQLNIDARTAKMLFFGNLKSCNKILKIYYGSRVWNCLKPNEQLCILDIFYAEDHILMNKNNRFYRNIVAYAKTSKSIYLKKSIIKILVFNNLDQIKNHLKSNTISRRRMQAIMLETK